MSSTGSAGHGRKTGAQSRASAAAALVRDPLTAAFEAPQPAGGQAAPESRPETRRARPKIVQRIDDPSPEKANAQALEDLASGVEGLAIVFEGAPNAFGNGLPATPEALAVALRDIPLMRTHLRLDVHPQSRASIDWLVHLLTERRVSPERLDISFGFDPAALFAGTGRLRMSIEAMLASMPQSLGHFFALGAPGILLEADGRVFHNAGATDAQELGIMLASAVTYLRMFEEARQPVLYAAAHIGFSLSIDQDHRRAIAKLQALRSLWARVLDSYSVPPLEPVVHAETSYRMLTTRAADANLARATVAAMAAIDAGATSISLLSPSLPSGAPDTQARRSVRNTLLVLGVEADVAPSGDVEDLAAAIGEAAWAELRRIEEEGGVLRSLLDGHVQARIAESRAALAESLRTGRPAIVGMNVHPAASERGMIAPPATAGIIEDGVIFCERLPIVRLEELLGESA